MSQVRFKDTFHIDGVTYFEDQRFEVIDLIEHPKYQHKVLYLKLSNGLQVDLTMVEWID